MQFLLFFFNDTATTEIYTLSLHDALPILKALEVPGFEDSDPSNPHPLTETLANDLSKANAARLRSEEHTSELQSRSDLVCRLLLEKKKKKVNVQIAGNQDNVAKSMHGHSG